MLWGLAREGGVLVVGPEIASACISALSLIVVAIVEAIAERERRRTRAEQEEFMRQQKLRDEERRHMDDAVYFAVGANLDACAVLLHQAKGDRLNGNVEAALENVTESQRVFSRTRDRIAANLL